MNQTVAVTLPQSAASGRYVHVRGRLKETDGEISIIEKTPAEVAGERLLRPLINAVTRCFHTASSIFSSIDRAFSFPVASATRLPDSKLEKIREHIAALGNVALSEDMVARILSDQAGNEVEPKVVAALKGIIDIVGAISDPSEFYNNLVVGGLENIAKEKLQKIQQMKKSYDNQLEQVLAARAKAAKSRSNDEIHHKMGLLGNEITEMRAQYFQLEEALHAKNKEADEAKKKFDQKEAELLQINRNYDALLAQRKTLYDNLKVRTDYRKRWDEYVEKYKTEMSNDQLENFILESEEFLADFYPQASEFWELTRQINSLKQESKNAAAIATQLGTHFVNLVEIDMKKISERKDALYAQLSEKYYAYKALKATLPKDEL